jgi:glutamate-1-semialdehyde 2,1-aminomutase
MTTEPKSFVRSEEMLEQAQQSIPLGSQTFSKSRVQYPVGVSPLFIQRGEGSKAWDVDGNCFLDFVSALCAITLGYNDPDVNAAVMNQLGDGTIFSLPHPVEHQVAERICEMVPCAERVRFGKNGSDATAGAVRIARAFTGRDHIAVCGYHGWQDWYIGSTARSRGVPKSTQELSHAFAYNDLDSLDTVLNSHRGEFAAIVIEPMNISWPKSGFLESVQERARAVGALLVFDETITGFRFSNGGAQELFGVTPDLATFGKGLANGFPLSAVAGRADIMAEMEEVFFSFTMGGETLSLAAALATLDKLCTYNVVNRLAATGTAISTGLESLIKTHGAESFAAVAGHPSWSFLNLSNTGDYSSLDIKTLFMQEMHQQGILTVGTHNVSFAHNEEDVAQLLKAYDSVLPTLVDAVKNSDLFERLRCQPLVPLFKVR